MADPKQETKFEPIPPPDEGEHMTIEEFLNSVKMKAYTPDDGIGFFATATHESDLQVWCPDLAPSWATHVVWYNK